MVRPPLFRDRISNCTNLFQPEPNQTRHRIFAFVSLLFRNLKVKMLHTHIYLSTTLDITYLPDIRTKVMSIVCSIFILYAKYLAKMLRMVRLQNKKCPKTGPKQRCSGSEQYQYPFWYYLYTLHHSTWRKEFLGCGSENLEQSNSPFITAAA